MDFVFLYFSKNTNFAFCIFFVFLYFSKNTNFAFCIFFVFLYFSKNTNFAFCIFFCIFVFFKKYKFCILYFFCIFFVFFLYFFCIFLQLVSLYFFCIFEKYKKNTKPAGALTLYFFKVQHVPNLSFYISCVSHECVHRQWSLFFANVGLICFFFCNFGFASNAS